MKNKEIMEKEIDLLQACINRMAQNSFLIKGWMISLVAVIIALLPEKIGVDVRVLCVVAFVVTVCFWYLDAFFLRMETLYRWKYSWVIENRQSTLDFAYDLNPHNDKTWVGGSIEPNILKIMFSQTFLPLYLLFFSIELFVFVNAFFNWF